MVRGLLTIGMAASLAACASAPATPQIASAPLPAIDDKRLDQITSPELVPYASEGGFRAYLLSLIHI